MSKITIALEAAVATVIENMPKDGAARTNRQRVYVDRAFAQILKLIAPRIRHFVRQYGLTAHWEDAEQCCAIAVHRAIESYDPTKAQFTTFVNWQIRGELQSLRFRLMTDQRPSAKKVEATTVSLSALAATDGDEIAPEAMIEDEDAVARTEAAASDYLAEGAVSQLIDAYVDQLRKVGVEALRRRPRSGARDRGEGPRFKRADPAELEKLEARLSRDREIVARRVFDGATLDEVSLDTGATKECVRQIARQATRLLTGIAAEAPRFEIMADDARRAVPPVRPRRAGAAKVPLLPDPGALHNRLAHVEAIEAERAAYVTPVLPVAQLVLH
ncbi:sigma-70 family RNA polymerase sigma factor [Sphingomonas sp. CBMAI 2297]|uniref:sigma factor n=1 Tax=Sphingomonas sp. CBMAI 2297 TaxID=2991720 RepID=UPI00245724E4|nr:sigma factor [Sphingomonas sp. CBMAI 2297]MDH4745564.1 sigma-70 family RNA polymerase sigma factor [Sphingomonas sp. CBMAI 2297]